MNWKKKFNNENNITTLWKLRKKNFTFKLTKTNETKNQKIYDIDNEWKQKIEYDNENKIINN